MSDLIERLDQMSRNLECMGRRNDVKLIEETITEIERLSPSNVGVDVGVENERLRDALRNMLGAFDTPIARRRYPPDDFMKECIQSARNALRPPSNVGVDVGANGSTTNWDLDIPNI